MKVQIFIGTDRIGEADLFVIDETMGVVGGQVISFPPYEKYRYRVRQETDTKGGVNIESFPFTIVSETGSLIQSQGGITLIDSYEFGEFSVEISGMDLSNLQI